jgi:hypothetical protein
MNENIGPHQGSLERGFSTRPAEKGAAFDAILLGTLTINGKGSSASTKVALGLESLNKTPLRLDNVRWRVCLHSPVCVD